jgi:PAS domain S-box-containing protein
MNSLLARLLLVVSVALAPALGFQAYTESEARRVRQQLVEEEALRLVRLIASDQQRIVEGAKQVLDTLSGTPAVQDNDLPGCQRLLANLQETSPRYNSAAVIGLDGHPVCAAVPFDRSLNVSASSYFRLSLQTGGFAIGEYAVGRISKKAGIHLARPFKNRDGVVAGVIHVTLDLDWLQSQLKLLALPAGAVASVVDRNGTVLARYPDGKGFVGQPIPAANRFTLDGDKLAVFQMTSQGHNLIVGYSPPAVEPKGLLIKVGLDRDITFPGVTQANRTGLMLIIGGGGLGLAITALLGRQLIRRPLDRLLRVADRWRTGDLAARTDLPKNKGEFGRLADAFDRMAAAQEARENALRNTLESTTDSVVAVDRAWRVTYLNEHAKTQLALQGRDILGQTLCEAFPALVGSVFADAVRTAMARGVPAHAEGCSPLFGKHFEGHAYPSKDGVTVFFRDVTEARRVSLALAESEARFRLFIDRAPAAIAMFDTGMRYLAVSRRFARDYRVGDGRPENLIGRSHYELFPDIPERWRDNHRRVLAGETLSAEDDAFPRADGHTEWVRWEMAPWRHADGTIGGALLFSEIITQRRETDLALRRLTEDLEARVREEVEAREAAQARAAQAERLQALGQLAGGIAHDFNNVLQAVESAAMLIERRSEEAAVVRRLARVVVEAVGRGASVTRRLLAFGRRGDLRPETLDVAPLLSGLHEILAHTLGAGIEVHVRQAADVPPLRADKGQLETVLINLATNARDAMPAGGRLTLLADTEFVSPDGPAHPAGLAPGRYVRLSVADTGTGMDADTLARVGQPFFTTKPMGVGTGLGLPMAKGFAGQSGGALSIDSSPGQGTTVTLWLPVAGADSGTGLAGHEYGADTIGSATGRAKPSVQVLVVDDEDLERETLAESLEQFGFTVLTASCGTEAIALLAAGEEVEALVTDLSMPGMDGLAVIRSAQEHRPGLPAVLMTGYAGDGAALAVGGAITGTFSLLRKPVHIDELADRIQSVIAARTKPARSTSQR